MVTKVIAPKYLLYMFFVVFTGNVFGVLMLLAAGVRSGNNVLTVFAGTLFSVLVVLVIIYLPKLIYLEVTEKQELKYGSLFFEKKAALTSIGSISKLKDPGFRIAISGKDYIMFSFKENVTYLERLIALHHSALTYPPTPKPIR